VVGQSERLNTTQEKGAKKKMSCFLSFIIFFVVVETRTCCVAQAGLELWILAQRAGITGTHHHAWLYHFLRKLGII
jgi:hypothetical protein